MKNFNFAIEKTIEAENDIFIKIKYSVFWINFTKEFLNDRKIDIAALKNAASISIYTRRELLTFLEIKSMDEIEQVLIIATKQ